MIDIDLIQKRLVNLIFLTILLYHLRFLRMKGYNKSMSKNKTRTFGISWWIGLVLFAGMICLMLGDILHRDGVIGSKTDVLVMGTNAGFKPFEYIDNNQVVGFDVDLAREIAKSLGKDLKVEDMSFDGLLPALDSGQIDMVAAGMTVTPEREKNALFSDPYYSASQRIIVKKGSPIRNKYQLPGRKIGVQLGTTGDTLASKIAGALVTQFQTAPSVLQELSSGKIEAVILDDAPAKQYSAGFSDLEILPGALSDESYAIAIKKDNKDLLEKVNKEITKMKKDGRYEKLIRKYFGEEAKS